MSALTLAGVHIALGGRAVLEGVDLTLEAGRVSVLAGRNGAGKTTLLRLATGLIAPDAGQVRLGDTPIGQLGRRELARRVAVVPQETRIPFPFRVLEVALMGRAPHLGPLGFESRADLACARAALERVGMAHLAERSVLEISGGESQLVVIARALAQEAPVLLLDEPTAHLDVERRLAVLAQLRSLAAEGRAILIVSHDLGLSARFADRIALLAGGRIVADASPDEALRPEALRAAFGIEAEVLRAADGSPVVVPRAPR